MAPDCQQFDGVHEVSSLGHFGAFSERLAGGLKWGLAGAERGANGAASRGLVRTGETGEIGTAQFCGNVESYQVD